MDLFPEFRASSWDTWRTILGRLGPQVREFYAIAGRGSGKSRMVAVLACYFAARDYRRAPGEAIYIGVFAPDRKQARVTFRYVVGLLRSVSALAALIVKETKESVELTNGVIIEVITASKAAPRARSYACAIIEEGAFLSPDEHSANPDVELLRALRPACARVPHALLCVVSTPYARRGVLWTAWQKYHGQPDGEVVLIHAPTLTLNPTFDRRAIDSAYLDDPVAAASEYDGVFRADLETFVAVDVLDACVVRGRSELPRVAGLAYHGFLDFAGGSGRDAATLAIGHRTRESIVIDCLRERRPPFSPEAVCHEFAALMTGYGVTTATSDRWGGEFPIEQLAKVGIRVTPSAQPKSELYLALLPLLNSRRVELLDHPRLLAQLGGLERRTTRGGRDTVDHGPGGHDDLANAAAGVVVSLSAGHERTVEEIAFDLALLQAGRRPSSGWDANGEPISVEDDDWVDDDPFRSFDDGNIF
jgi:hypothetical protein